MANIFPGDEPAQYQFINTFSPIPFGELMQAGAMKAKQQDQGFESLMQNYEDTNNLKYIPNSKDEQYVKQVVIPHVKSVVDKYANQDLSDAIVKRQMRMELNNGIDKNRIRDIQNSFEGYKQYVGEKMKLQQKNMLSPLEGTPHANWDSSTQGTFAQLPKEFINPYKGIKETYFSNLKSKILRNPKNGEPLKDSRGYYTSAITADRIAQETELNLDNALSSTDGKNTVALWRQEHNIPQTISDRDVLRQAMLSLGHDKIQDDIAGSPWQEWQVHPKKEKTPPGYDGVGRLPGISVTNTKVNPNEFDLQSKTSHGGMPSFSSMGAKLLDASDNTKETTTYYKTSLLDKPEVKDLINLLPDEYKHYNDILTGKFNKVAPETKKEAEEKLFSKLKEVYNGVQEHLNKSSYYLKYDNDLAKIANEQLFGPDPGSNEVKNVGGGNFINSKVLKLSNLKSMTGSEFNSIVKKVAEKSPTSKIVAVGDVHPDNKFGHPSVGNDPDFRKGRVVTMDGENYLIADAATSELDIMANKTYQQMSTMQGTELSEPDLPGITEINTKADTNNPAMFVFKDKGKVVSADIEFDKAYNKMNEYLRSKYTK